ncbi:MAG: zinc ribbon domain-containing protein, partial [Candidatus ainarchaeum sp.]|nr:zinc ribbon domain-containing protein [Candidatus ainarchaeum sp.]
QGFTKNFSDNSTAEGFQFTFNCVNCRDGYKTKFVASETAKKGKLLKTAGGLFGAVAQLAGKSSIGYGVDRGVDAVSGRFTGMSPDWHKEHDAAFEKAQNEAKANFHKCPNCANWVCETCWNEQEGLCVKCAPRENVSIATTVAKAKRTQMEKKAAETKLFTGELESKVTECPACGKPAGKGKFCVNCGAPMGMVKCRKCGAKNPPGTKFCGECGEKP